MDTVCAVCDGTEFSIIAGFYYCDTCGEKATLLQEVEDEADGQFQEIPTKSHKIKQVTKTERKIRNIL